MEPRRESAGTAQACTVRRAMWPQDEAAARELLQRYFNWLAGNPAVPASIRAKDRDPELSSLLLTYTGQGSVLFLAADDQQLCGCASVTLLAQRPGAAELKRLYVLPMARGHGSARALVHACATWSAEQGATELLLDTLPAAMPAAIRIYRSTGFQPTEPYNGNDSGVFAFYRMALTNWESTS